MMEANAKRADSEVTTDASLCPPATIEQLAASQQVMPAMDVDVLGASWPIDDDPDDLDTFIAAQRASRRMALVGRVQRG